MEHPGTTPPDNTNDPEKLSLPEGEEQPEELKPDQADSDSTAKDDPKPTGNSQPDGDTELAKASKHAPVVPSSDGRSIGLGDITQIKFKPPLPSKGPMSDFVAKASADLGLPKSHAWAIWIFTTMAYCGHKVFHDDGCLERRVAPNIILAGDDDGGLARRVVVEALNRKGEVHVLTNPAVLQKLEALEDFSADVRRIVVDTADENLFLKWHKGTSENLPTIGQNI